VYSDALSTHPDGIECNGISDGDTGCIHTLVYNNTVYDQSQNIYFEGLGTAAQNADLWIFNNVVYTNPVSSTGVVLSDQIVCCDINVHNGTTVHIFNNTLGPSQNGFMAIFLQTYSDAHLKNNIITHPQGTGIRIDDPSVVAELDYNIYNVASSGGNGLIQWSGTFLTTLAQVRSVTGDESHGVQADPLVNAFPTPTLKSGSPAIGAGVNLTSIGVTQLNFDFTGAPRPSSGSWDIGAYVYGSPIPPTGLTAVVH